MRADVPSGLADEARDARFLIQTHEGVVLGATDHGLLAYPMYRAAAEEYGQHRVILRDRGGAWAPIVAP